MDRLAALAQTASTRTFHILPIRSALVYGPTLAEAVAEDSSLIETLYTLSISSTVVPLFDTLLT